jgi:hypothetical protein
VEYRIRRKTGFSNQGCHLKHMQINLLKLSRSSFFNISSVGFVKGLLAYIYFEQTCVLSHGKLN